MERSRFLSEHNSLPILCSTKMGWWTISYALSPSISLVYGLLWSLFLPSEHLHKTPTNNILYGVCMFQVNNTINKMAHSLKLNLEIKGMCLKWWWNVENEKLGHKNLLIITVCEESKKWCMRWITLGHF